MSVIDNNHQRPAKSRGKVLVTGSEGFTGSYLIPALEADGWTTVRAVRADGVRAPQVTLDLADPEGMTQVLRNEAPSAIVHLAAISFVGHSNAAEIYQTNTIGTLNLLTAIQQAGLTLTHLVVASSAAVYGDQAEAELHEELTPNPTSDYGISKLSAEQLALARSTAQNLIVTRPFNYTGHLQQKSFLIPKLVHHFARREPAIELGNIDVAREFNDVRWLVDNYRALLAQDSGVCRLNLCSGNAHKLRDLLDLLEDITSYRPEVKINPQFVRANDPSLIKGSTRVARSLGLPEPTGNPEGALRQLLEWMCDRYDSKA